MTRRHCFFQLGGGILLKIQIQCQCDGSTVNRGLCGGPRKPSTSTVNHVVALPRSAGELCVALRFDAVEPGKALWRRDRFSNQTAQAVRRAGLSNLHLIPVQTGEKDTVLVPRSHILLSFHDGWCLGQHVAQLAVPRGSSGGSVSQVSFLDGCFYFCG